MSESNPEAVLCEPTEPLVTASGLMKGSITFSPDQSKPCYCPTCVLAEQEVQRLLLGNAVIMRENYRLQRELETANATIRSFETKIHMEGK
jgi:hypothetical protein